MTELVKRLRKGLLFVVSAPAGTGKTTLVHKLIQEFPDRITQSMSCTTRAPRKGEIDGKDYLFLTKEAFDKRVQAEEFLEHATVFEDHYGTLKSVVESIRNVGKHVVLVIDTQGARALKEKVDGVFIFIAPPSMEVLKERLEERETETKRAQQTRLEWAQKEMEQVEHYHYSIVNDDLDMAYQTLKSIVVAETHRTNNMTV